MTVTINVSGLEPIVEAINNLARALGAAGVSNPGMPQTPSAPQMPPAAPNTAYAGEVPGTAPTTGFTPPTNNFPFAGSTPGPAPVPTTAPAPQGYTQDQIAVAMTGLVDQGKMAQVTQVLAQFGAASLMQVPKEQYGALATQLRMLGAAI